MSAASILRNETRPDHVRTEAAFAGFDLSTPESYARFLTAQASAFLAVEQSLEDAGVAALVEDWPGRRRADLLLDDLAQLDVRDIRLQQSMGFEGEAQIMGGLYVIEGSRLGGKFLSAQVPAGAPLRFLRADSPPGAWKKFLDSLDLRLTGCSDINLAVDAARRVFGSFERAARETGELCLAR